MFSWVSLAHYSFLEIDKGLSKFAKNPNILICNFVIVMKDYVEEFY